MLDSQMVDLVVMLAMQPARPAVHLRGLSVVDAQTVWASGQNGGYRRTVDAGAAWSFAAVPDASALDFRDVHAFSASEAVLMSAGPGESSRVYRTVDAGEHWTAALRNQDPAGFYDCMAFWDARRGLLLGDPVDGRFVVMRTADGGATWSRAPLAGMPPARPGEGAFAASGTCLATGPGGRAWFGTGGENGGRVFRTEDGGDTWTAVQTPVRHDSPGAGIFSIAFFDALHGVAVGGDYAKSGDDRDNAIVSDDGGRTWRLISGQRPGGYREAVAWIDADLVVTVGPKGADISRDRGRSWIPLDWSAHAVAVAPDGAVWTAGAAGFVRRHVPPQPAKPSRP